MKKPVLKTIHPLLVVGLQLLAPSFGFAQNLNFWGDYNPGQKTLAHSTAVVAPDRSYFTTEVQEVPGGAKLIVHLTSGELNAPISLDLLVAINDGQGKVMPISIMHLSDAIADNPTTYTSTREYTLDYQQLNDALAKILPPAAQHMKIGPGSGLFLIGQWPNHRHTWGGIGRGGIFFMPENQSSTSNLPVASNRQPEELDLAFPISAPMTYKYNEMRETIDARGVSKMVNTGLKLNGQIRSRLEKEGKFQVPLAQSEDVRKKLFAMANDPAEALRILGPDWKVAAEMKYMKKDAHGNTLLDQHGLPTPDPMVDTYYDNDTMDAAKNDIALRYRWTEQNGTGAWNIKPGGGRTSPEGAVSRIEYGVDTTDDKPETVKAFADSTDPLNPFRTIRSVIPNATPSDFLKPALKITDTRFKFKFTHTNGLVIEVSLDDVYTESLRKGTAGRYVQLEMDVDHLSTTSANVASFAGAHSASVLASTLTSEMTQFANGLTSTAFLDGRPAMHGLVDLDPSSPVLQKHGADFALAETAIVAVRNETVGKNWLPAPQKASLAARLLGLVDAKDVAPSVKALVNRTSELRKQNINPGKVMERVDGVGLQCKLILL